MFGTSISQGSFNSSTPINSNTQQFNEIVESTKKQFGKVTISPKNNAKRQESVISIYEQKKQELEKALQEYEKVKKELLEGIDLCEKSISTENSNNLLFSESSKNISNNIILPFTKETISNPLVKEGDGPDPHFPYSQRIYKWYSQTDNDILCDNRYAWISNPEFTSIKEYLIQIARITHTFGRALDPILVKLGTTFVGKSLSTGRYEENYCLPGELSLPQEPLPRTGIYTLSKGDNDTFFHRYFSQKTENKFVQDYERENIFKANVAYPSSNNIPQPDQNKNTLSQDDGSQVDHVCNHCITVKCADGIGLKVYPFPGEVFQL